jgi:hypothetical protein
MCRAEEDEREQVKDGSFDIHVLSWCNHGGAKALIGGAYSTLTHICGVVTASVPHIIISLSNSQILIPKCRVSIDLLSVVD